MNQQAVPLNHYMLSECTMHILPKDMLVSMHKHREIEILMVKSGEILFNVGGAETLLKSDDIIIVSGNIPHSTLNLTDISHYLMYLSPSIIDLENTIEFPDLYQNSPFVVIRKNSKYHSELSGYILQYSDITNKYYKKAYAYLIAGVLDKMNFFDSNIDRNSLSDKHMNTIKYVKNYVNEHIYESIKINDIANELFIDPSYLCRIFKKATRYTITDFINYKKINLAKELLTSTNMSVADIAYKLSFSSSSYFIKIFRQYNIFTPCMYREAKRTPMPN